MTMRPRLGLRASAVLPLLLAGRAATAQTTRPTDDRVDRLERRLDEMDRERMADLRARDEEIARLRAALQQRDQSATRPSAAPDDIRRKTDDVLGEIEGTSPRGPATGATEQAVDDARRDAEARSRSPFTLQSPVSFNPDLAVITDFTGSYSTDRANPARNRFDVREVELDLRAAVDPRADAVAVIPFSRDVGDPLFFRDRSDASGAVDSGVDVEEAYLFLHDFGMPNLTAKLGRFHLRFGRWDVLHKHDWATTDNTFVNQSFLGPESLVDQGLSLSYVIPPKLVAGQYVEVIAEVISGEGDAGNPVLNNDALVHSPALNTHLLWNRDFGDWNLELGGSWLTGHHNADNLQSFNLFGTDLTLIHTDPTGGFNNQLVQFEAMYGDVDTSRTRTQHGLGAFLLLQQQLNRDFYAGVRLDWTKDAVDDRREVWGVSPYVSWYWSEFLRFRLEYQHKAGDVRAEDSVFFQATWIFGAHPPHPYWAMK
jgi:hypothetical protein